MKALYFDCFSGISGDMSLAALLDLGIDEKAFRSELDKLNLAGYDIVVRKKVKNGITGMDVQVILHDRHEGRQEEAGHSGHAGHEQDGHPGHQHEHEHGHDHSHQHQPQEVHEHHHHARNLADIEELIDASGVRQKVKDFSKKVFREIARAEAKVHDKPIHEVHFHEVGAVDSIVDIVGAAICLDLLGVDRIFSSPLHDGKGFIECRHGMLPVPVPAVMEMLSESGIPLITEDISTELVTPTGIGIIKCLTSHFGNMPAMRIERVGYGMGKRETGRFNALRVILGTLLEEEVIREEIVVLETNIDDMSPELLGFVMESLLKHGALDVFYSPIYMKKNRPSVMLTVLAQKDREEELADILLKETTTLGVRRNISQRYCMHREIVKVKTELGEVRVKVASKGEFRKLAPEYEDCREIANYTGLPIHKVYGIVNESAKYLL